MPITRRLDAVDLLRGLSILLVLMNHVNMRLVINHIPYTQGLPDQLVSSLVWNGQRGVQIFFAVSGFLITTTSLRRWGALSSVSIRGFYKLRFARIAPLLGLLLLILSVLHAVGLENFVISSRTGGLGRALAAALTFHINVLEATRGYLPGNWDILWSLSVEEMFYLFFPLVCRASGEGRMLIAILVAFVAAGPIGRTVLAANNEVWREYSYLGGMDAIAMGCLTALSVARFELKGATLRIIGAVGAGILLFSLAFSLTANRWGLERRGLSMTLTGLGACMVLYAGTISGWKSPRLFAPVLRMGQLSYEIYLTHMFVVFAVFDLFLKWGKPLGGVPVLFGAVIALSGLSAYVVARFYSEPLNRWLRRTARTPYEDNFPVLASDDEGGEPARS